MAARARIIRHGEENWVSVKDLRRLLNDDECIMHAAAMLKFSLDKKLKPLDILRNGIAYFFTESMGFFDHLGN